MKLKTAKKYIKEGALAGFLASGVCWIQSLQFIPKRMEYGASHLVAIYCCRWSARYWSSVSVYTVGLCTASRLCLAKSVPCRPVVVATWAMGPFSFFIIHYSFCPSCMGYFCLPSKA